MATLKYGISPRLLRKVLELAVVDDIVELIQKNQSGEVLSEIAASICMHVTSLARLFKANGHQVQTVPRTPPLTQRQVVEAIFKRQTINTVARKLQLHWKTTKKLLVEFGFLSEKCAEAGAPYHLAIPKKFHLNSLGPTLPFATGSRCCVCGPHSGHSRHAKTSTLVELTHPGTK